MITFIEAFAGGGGLSTGLRAAGLAPAGAVEIDVAASDTLRANHPGVPVWTADVRSLGGDDLLRHAPGGPRRGVSVFAAGIPCQTFSFAGPRSRASFDGRQELFREAVRLAAEVQAGILLFENVPGIRTKPLHEGRPGLVIDEIYRSLDAAGYVNRLEAVADAADYGVPQHRERWFLLAARDRSLTLRFPEPTTAARPVTVREALAGLPRLPGGASYTERSGPYADRLRDPGFWRTDFDPGRLSHHVGPRHRPATVARYSLLRPGERVADLLRRLDAETVADFQKRAILPWVGFLQRARLHPDRPAFAQTTHCGEDTIVWHDNRVVTVREAARLQGFHDGYKFCGKLLRANNDPRRSVYAQIGNAVPPLLAYHVGVAVKEVLR